MVISQWGISAAGSAQHWQCWGQGFESPMLHQNLGRKSAEIFCCVALDFDQKDKKKINNNLLTKRALCVIM